MPLTGIQMAFDGKWFQLGEDEIKVFKIFRRKLERLNVFKNFLGQSLKTFFSLPTNKLERFVL
jgi:hypothetical protein